MKDRLTKSDWIKHGLRTLAEDGSGALKVGTMATKLRVSRGSFYWHFRDIAEFRFELLRSWQERTTDAVIRKIQGEAEPDRLKQLISRAFVERQSADTTATQDDWDAERAIRSWAAYDASVAATVASGDVNRVDYIAQLLITAGVDSRKAQARAAFMYWAYLGQAFVMEARLSSIAQAELNEISDLFER